MSITIEEGSVKAKVLTAIVLAQLVLSSSMAWGEESPDPRPRISNIGGDDRSPGVTLVVIATLLLIGFGLGLTVGRRTRRK